MNPTYYYAAIVIATLSIGINCGLFTFLYFCIRSERELSLDSALQRSRSMSLKEDLSLSKLKMRELLAITFLYNSNIEADKVATGKIARILRETGTFPPALFDEDHLNV